MTLWTSRFARLGSLLMVASVMSSGITLRAATWDGGGGDNNWGTAGNWTGDQAPVYPESLIFTGSTRLTPNNEAAGRIVENITFDSGAGAFVIGGMPFTLGVDTVADYRDGGIDQLDADVQTINNDIAFARGQNDIKIGAGAGNLVLNGAISRNVGAALHFEPTATSNIKTTLTNTNGLLGGWATIKNPSPFPGFEPWETYLYAKVDAMGNVVPYLDYTPDDNIDGFNGETSFPAGMGPTRNIRWFGGPGAAENLVAGPGITDMNTFIYDGRHIDLARVMIGAGNTLRFSDGGGFFRSHTTGETNVIGLGFLEGTITAGHSAAPATLYVQTNTSVNPEGMSPDGEDDNFTISLNGTVIADNPDGGAVTVVSTGPGGVRTENAAHTFTGGLYINRGVWRAQGTGGATPFGLGDVHVASGAQAYINNGPLTFENDFYLAGRGIDEAAFFVGAMRIAANSAILNGDIILTADTRLGNRGAQATAVALGGTNQGVLFNGKITGDFDFELSIKNDQGIALGDLEGNMPTMILANSANDWGGETTIGNGRIRIGGTGEVIPHGPGKGNVTLLGEGAGTARATILTLDGNTETINGLNSSGVHAEVFITNQVASSEATLKVGGNNASGNFAGTILDGAGDGKLHVTKIGSGTQILSGPNAYTGDTRVEGGTLTIGSGAAISGEGLLANMADIFINTGAVLNLDFSGTDMIDALYLGNAPQQIGTYGSMSSSAAFKSDFFAGMGILSVTTVGPPIAGLAGDYNGNGIVDAADYTIWRDLLGTATQLQNEASGVTPGMVTQEDYDAWKSNFGATLGSGSGSGTSLAAVPEPSTLGLMLVACVAIVGGRRRS